MRKLISLAAVAVFVVAGTSTQAARADSGYQLKVDGIQIEGPTSSDQTGAWRTAMLDWRAQQRAAMNYDDTNYTRPELQWAQDNPVQPQMMVHDRDFYDPVSGRYTVDRYLADVQRRYGGIDSVLVWPTYPNIGVDSRNTDQMIRDMPGGIPGLRTMVADFHRHGVKVLFPIHPWDNGTQDPGTSWATVLPKTMAEIGADGLNGDTLGAVTPDYFDNSVADGNPLVLEPELGVGAGSSLDNIQWNTQSWGYWNYTSYAPLVSSTKWLEPRHTVHVNDRWSKSKIDMLQAAFFNGTGLESWENVWGIWNQMTDRDDEATRRVATIEREFPALLVSQKWEPYTATLQNDKVFASKWPSETTDQTLWTLVDRNAADANGAQLSVPYRPGQRFFDVWNGAELHPTIGNGTATLAFPIEGHGFGAILASSQADLPAHFSTFLTTMHRWSARPLSSYPAANTVLPQTMTTIHPTRPTAQTPPGMVAVPGADEFPFTVQGTEIEGGNDPGVDVQYPWETQPNRYHATTMAIKPFYLDQTEVTNAEYQSFMDATRYRPKDMHNFLKDWDWSDPSHPHYRTGWANKPVTWVSIEDSRSYASWAGKRLPEEWEWQYAAQGLDGRNYPWGNAFSAERVPATYSGRDTLPPPANVDAHPAGASPFGALDMVGNVWQWTNEFTDQHTRTAVVRGGSYYRPQGSTWYFPSDQSAYQLDHHNKYLLMAPSLDRAATIGFRCAEDALAPTPPPAVDGTVVDDTAPGWTLNGWTNYSDASAYQGSAIGGAGASGQQAAYTFTGRGLDLYGWRGPNGGQLQVKVDGRSYSVDQQSATDVYHQLLLRVGGLTSGRHTVRVSPAASTRPDQRTMIDYLRVYAGAPPPAPPQLDLDHRLVAPGSAITATVRFTNTSDAPVSGELALDAPLPIRGHAVPFTRLAPQRSVVAHFTVRVSSSTDASYLLRAIARLRDGRQSEGWRTVAVLGPIDAVAAGENTNAIDVSWTSRDPDGAATYELYGSTDPGFTPGPSTLLARTNATSYRHADLSLTRRWYYRVRMTDGATASGPYSPIVNAISGSVLAIEAEALIPLTEATAPYTILGDCCGVHWSGSQTIWFQAKGVGDRYALTFTVPDAGNYDLTLSYALASDFGIHTQTLDGTALGGPYDHHGSTVSVTDQDYGRVHLTSGRHTLAFTITGKDVAAAGYGFGLDRIVLHETAA